MTSKAELEERAAFKAWKLRIFRTEEAYRASLPAQEWVRTGNHTRDGKAMWAGRRAPDESK